MNPELLSAQMKLHMQSKDYAAAEKCAEQLVAAAPAQFKGYMVYFSILMAAKRYDAAQTVLNDAGKYATLSDADAFALVQQKAALLVAKAEHGLMDRRNAGSEAEKMLIAFANEHQLSQKQMVELRLLRAEICTKTDAADQAIEQLNELLYGPKKVVRNAVAAALPDELTTEDLEEMVQSDMERIQEKIDSGELDDDLGMYAETDFDEDGVEIRIYDDAALTAEAPSTSPEVDEMEPIAPVRLRLSAEEREKAQFLLLTCYLEQDDFVSVSKIAQQLKASENKYYRYYGIYTDALAERKVNGDSVSTQRKYAEALAFFRSRSFSDKKDVLASVFRARLYAEQRQYAKAQEIAQLLSDADRKAVCDYIEKCGA